MQGSLGEKIGEGVFADVYAWAPGQVVKLFKSGVSQRLCRHEARMTRAVFAAGVLAPEVFDEVTLEGRFGIVLSRFDGSTLHIPTKPAGYPEVESAIHSNLIAATVPISSRPGDAVSSGQFW